MIRAHIRPYRWKCDCNRRRPHTEPYCGWCLALRKDKKKIYKKLGKKKAVKKELVIKVLGDNCSKCGEKKHYKSQIYYQGKMYCPKCIKQV